MNANQVPTYSELNAVLDQARRPSSSPTQITDAQLLGLQHRWTTMLSARLDQALEDAGYGPTGEAVVDASRKLAADQPVLRGVLDEGRRRSAALADAMSGEFRILALAAGLVGLDTPEDRAARLGREFRDQFTGTAPARTMHHVA
jgi:hypothetical protein